MSPRYSRAQQGFTLVELMVTVAIIGILAGIATVYTSGDKDKVERTAQLLANRVGEASRQAHMSGPIQESVAVAEDSRERTRLFIGKDGEGQQFLTVDLRVPDDDTTSSWSEIRRDPIPVDVTVVGAEVGVARTQSGEDAMTELGDDDFELLCQPSGACGPATLFLQGTNDEDDKWRIVIFPLSSSPVVLTGW